MADEQVTDQRRMEWLEFECHCMDWTNDGERRVVRAGDGKEFIGDSWRACIDQAINTPDSIDEDEPMDDATRYALGAM